MRDKAKYLEPLRDVPPRDPATIHERREAFITSAGSLPKPVSVGNSLRHKGWSIFSRKEQNSMFTFVRLALALAVVIGGAGTAAVAAQASSPSEILYPVKLVVEDARLALNQDPQVEFELLLGMVEERLSEIRELTDSGQTVPPQVPLRLEQQLNNALKQVAQMDDADMLQAMEQVRTMMREESRLLVGAGDSAGSEDALRQTERIMSEIHRVAEDAITDPTQFRLREAVERPLDAPEQPENNAPFKDGEMQGNDDFGGDKWGVDCDPLATDETGCGPRIPQGTGTPGGKGFGPGKSN